MPAIHLPPRKAPMLRIMPALVLYPHRVHCSVPGCGWSRPVRDESDAYVVLETHLNSQAHQEK